MTRPTVNEWLLVDHQSNQSFVFDGAGVLVTLADRNNNPVSFSYDTQSSATNRITGSAGFNPANSTMVGAGSNGHLDSIALAAGDGSTARTTSFACFRRLRRLQLFCPIAKDSSPNYETTIQAQQVH